MSVASFGVSSLTTVTGVVHVAADPLSGTTQTNAMLAKKKRNVSFIF
jgi:hypothetical protein